MTPGGKAYVANFGDNTISVIDASTNAVTATLHARGNPEDVTISSTSRPRILNYTFQSLEIPGAVDTVPQAINNLGQIVGSYANADGTRHGFLRQPNGAYTTVDLPGATQTFAVGINDLGMIVGDWEDANGQFHGFTRGANGSFSTVDFPGAVDTGVFGINDFGMMAGVYDLGDQTTNISCALARGTFMSFEEPAAAPMQTVAEGINVLGVISGFFNDPSGNTHGYVRGVDRTFHSFDFPGADYTDTTKINSFGQLVGGTLTNFPLRGYIYTATNKPSGSPSPAAFFSFDYPDSKNSTLHGINDLGQLVGFYRGFGSVAMHGFLATPSDKE